jgi:hypothetical protein
MSEISHNRTAGVIKWTARVVASLVSLLFLGTLIYHLMDIGRIPIDEQSITFFGFGFIGVAGSILSWWKLTMASVLLLICSIGLVISTYFTGGRYSDSLVMIIPYLISSILIFSSHRLKNRLHLTS